jgi:hypothetical protein
MVSGPVKMVGSKGSSFGGPIPKNYQNYFIPSYALVYGIKMGWYIFSGSDYFWLALVSASHINLQSFWKVLLIWGIIGLLALLRPYGDAGRPILSEVSWAIPLIAAHLLTTLLFGGDPRFHFPIDPLVVFFGFAGTLLTAYYLLKHDLWLALLSGLLVAIRVIKP